MTSESVTCKKEWVSINVVPCISHYLGFAMVSTISQIIRIGGLMLT